MPDHYTLYNRAAIAHFKFRDAAATTKLVEAIRASSLVCIHRLQALCSESI